MQIISIEGRCRSKAELRRYWTKEESSNCFAKPCLYEQKPLEDFSSLNLFADYSRGDPIPSFAPSAWLGMLSKGPQRRPPNGRADRRLRKLPESRPSVILCDTHKFGSLSQLVQLLICVSTETKATWSPCELPEHLKIPS